MHKITALILVGAAIIAISVIAAQEGKTLKQQVTNRAEMYALADGK